MLIATDLHLYVRGLSYSVVNENLALARQSILRVADYPFERVVVGHGDALDQHAAQQLKNKFA